jgi:hypothetical protein
LRQNQFGLEFDGPVVIPKLYNGKDKTFFMASYEGYRLRQQSTSLSTQMPVAFFNGDFSSVPSSSITGGAVKDPLSGNAPFPGNLVPEAQQAEKAFAGRHRRSTASHAHRRACR